MLTNDNIRLVVADDHEVYRYGLEMLFREQKGIELVGTAANGRALVHLTAETMPDVVLTDLRLPEMGGVEAIAEITRSYPSVRSVAISTFDHEHLIIEALDAGALGYISKTSDMAEVVEAVQTVHQGYPFYCRKTTMRMIKLIASSRSGRPLPGAPPTFTDREKQVIRLICLQKTSKEIGRELFLSGRTIEKCRLDILDKMGERTTIGIVLYAIRAGLFTIE